MILFVVWNSGTAQQKTDAAHLITTAQINQLLGCDVNDGALIMHGKYCNHGSAGNKTGVIVQYVDFYTQQGAAYAKKYQER